jgi:RNA polymerase sigma-70 factor (ECF subfamily)
LSTWGDLEQLYLRYSRSVYRRARQLLADDEAARDATQEVFMRVMRAGGKVPADPTPTAWLHCVTTNFCLNQLRDRKRQSALLALQYQQVIAVESSGEARVALQQIVRHVPAQLQEVAVYFFIDELTYDEIARLMGVSRRTVSNRLAEFREQMEGMFPNLRLVS